MAEGTPVEDLVLGEIRKACTGQCPFKWGDGEQQVIQLKGRVKERLRFRVAWGHEVRVLDRKNDKLRGALASLITKLENNSVTALDIASLKNLLKDSEHDPVQERIIRESTEKQ